MIKTALFIFFIYTGFLFSQKLEGNVNFLNELGERTPIENANVYWSGSSVGGATNVKGEFSLPLIDGNDTLVISATGFESRRLAITREGYLNITLQKENYEINEVEVTSNKPSIQADYLGAENRLKIGEKELFKAACCNLSESFETNVAVDVSFTDAITGAKQIELLGLSGIYTQTTMESLPNLRGLTSSAGLMFIPGSWMKAINVSKGIGPVSEGFESITGSIDIEMQNPADREDERLFINLFGDNDRRFEGNINYRHHLNDYVSSITMLHSSRRDYSVDENIDGFTDMPEFENYNLMQRWNFTSDVRLEGQFGISYLNDQKRGAGNRNYFYSSKSRNFNIYGKTGYLLDEDGNSSLGLKWSYNSYNNKGLFGNRGYEGEENTGYINLMYETKLGEDLGKLRAGGSYMFDNFIETALGKNYVRNEQLPGGFVELNYTPTEEITFIAGFRGDYHNVYGMLGAPRIHLRYQPDQDWVVRGVAGKGYRTSNIFAEYSQLFITQREVVIDQYHSYGYGLEKEAAWNFGGNIIHYFEFNDNEATVAIDFYRTTFEVATVADWDSDIRMVTFSSLENGAYSNTLQFEFNFFPLKSFEARAAYRYVDSKQLINGEMTERPLNSKHRMLVNLSYATEGRGMVYDLTASWFGKKRIPSTLANPSELRFDNNSPSFAVINAQVTRNVADLFELYLGVENLFDYRQERLFLDSGNPFGAFFDGSMVWGPVMGRGIYFGLRYSLK